MNHHVQAQDDGDSIITDVPKVACYTSSKLKNIVTEALTYTMLCQLQCQLHHDSGRTHTPLHSCNVNCIMTQTLLDTSCTVSCVMTKVHHPIQLQCQQLDHD